MAIPALNASLNYQRWLFKRITLSFWAWMVSFGLVIAFGAKGMISDSMSPIMTLIVFMIAAGMIVGSLVFFVSVLLLVHATGKSAILWACGMLIFGPIGGFVAYFNLLEIAREKCWIVKKRRRVNGARLD